MSKKGNENKNKFLGMPYGTACHRLRKMVMFDLLKQLDKNFCYKCSKIIKNIDDLSMDHKKPWLWVDKVLFWDLDNVTFSHVRCNGPDRPAGTSEVGSKNPLAKKYIITTPEGEEIFVHGIANFCRNYKKEKLYYGDLIGVAKGKLKQCKGYKCRYCTED